MFELHGVLVTAASSGWDNRRALNVRESKGATQAALTSVEKVKNALAAEGMASVLGGELELVLSKGAESTVEELDAAAASAERLRPRFWGVANEQAKEEVAKLERKEA